MSLLNIVDRSGLRKYPVRSGDACFPAHRTVKLGNVDSRNVSVAVVLASLDRWGIEHCDGIGRLRRSEVRNLRSALFGPRGTKIVPRNEGQMAFELFDGMLYLDYEPPTAGRSRASYVRLSILERGTVQ